MLYASEHIKRQVQELWGSPDTFGTSLAALVLDAYGTEALDWDPEATRDQLREDVGIRIPRASFDRYMAIVTILKTNLFQTSIMAMHNIANALNGSAVEADVFDPVTVEELAWAVTEVTMNDPPENRKPLAGQYSPDVLAYMGAILADEGFVTLPKALTIVSLPSRGADRTFADDPVMFGAINQLSQDKVKDVDRYVDSRLLALTEQLKRLPVQHAQQNS